MSLLGVLDFILIPTSLHSFSRSWTLSFDGFHLSLVKCSNPWGLSASVGILSFNISAKYLASCRPVLDIHRDVRFHLPTSLFAGSLGKPSIHSGNILASHMSPTYRKLGRHKFWHPGATCPNPVLLPCNQVSPSCSCVQRSLVRHCP